MSTVQPADVLNAMLHPAQALSSASLKVPETHEFAKYPSSWYLFGPAKGLNAGPLSARILDRDLVAFRAVDGQVVVMEGRCSHLAGC